MHNYPIFTIGFPFKLHGRSVPGSKTQKQQSVYDKNIVAELFKSTGPKVNKEMNRVKKMYVAVITNTRWLEQCFKSSIT